MGRFSNLTDAAFRGPATTFAEIPAPLRAELEAELPQARTPEEEVRKAREVERMYARLQQTSRVPEAVKLEVMEGKWPSSK